MPLLASFALPVDAQESSGGPRLQEYFVRQQADEGLLIRIDGVEARFESVVSTVAGEPLAASGVPGSRVAPLYQYVAPTKQDRQLDIRITAPFDTNRTRFDTGLSRVVIRDDRSARLARAYQLLSFGLELPPADTAANWSVKVGALRDASRQFEAFGMEELQLWAAYFAGQVTLLGLSDNDGALQAAEALLEAPGTRRYERLRMAALRLRAEALAALRGAGQLPSRTGPEDPVQVAALAAADFAATLGLQFERADALFLAGRDLAARGPGAEALPRLAEALDLAVAIEADDLATEIREALVLIHGAEGDVAATSEVLQAIESQLTEEGANDDLARNLLAQGRILNRTFRFDAAREVLRQALEFEHNSLTRSQVRLALAEAAWAVGDLDEAWAQARSAVTQPETGGFRRPTAVLDVQRGVAILAGVARARGDGAGMAELREAQRGMLDTDGQRVLWNWERAQDELATGRSSRSAVPLLRRVRDTAIAAGLGPLDQAAVLWLCRLGTDCPGNAAERARRALRDSGIPRYQVAAEWHYGAWLAERGRRGEAVDVLDGVVGEMIFLRYALPGVLGDWYWRRLDEVSADLLGLRRGTGRNDRLLLDLARLRWLRSSDQDLGLPFERSVAGLDTDAFRALLARRARPEPGDDPEALAATVRSQLTSGRERFRAAAGFLEPRGFDRWLAALEPGAAVLDFDLSGGRALALIGEGARVDRVDLGPAARFAGWPGLLERLPDLEVGEFDAAMRTAGRRWLAPLRDRLPGRVYLAFADGLSGLPFEAFEVDGAPFAAQRAVLRLASFPARTAPAERLGPFTPDRVFLAGAPVDFSPGFLDRLQTGAELRAVMDRFRGPGLQVIQGAALQPDELDTLAYREASLVHLAQPARDDYRRPGAAWLEFSEPVAGAGRLRMRAAGLAAMPSSARLTVLSQATVAAGAGGSGRPPLASNVLAAGSGAVLVTAWPGEEEDAAAFFGAFYDAALDGVSLDQAFRAAVDARREQGTDWARYRLWVD